MIYFITGNENKFKEVKEYLKEDIEQINIDLPEIQSIDSKEVIKAKLIEALKHRDGEFIIEDTSLYFDGLNGLPGPLIKWFMSSVGNEGLYKIANTFNNLNAEAKTIFGYAKNKDEIYFFEGMLKGKITSPKGDKGFGWDPIFIPNDSKVTLAEMDLSEKNKISMRKEALSKLKEFLSK